MSDLFASESVCNFYKLPSRSHGMLHNFLLLTTYAVLLLEVPFVKFSIKSFKGFLAITLAKYSCVNCSNDHLGKGYYSGL